MENKMENKMVWKKCNSVTTGGKKYFYFASTFDNRYWVSWDRYFKCWTVDINGKKMIKVESIKNGKLLAEKLNNEYIKGKR